MTITFKNIVPAFLAENIPSQSDVWDREQQFLKGEKLVVSAASGKGKSTMLAYLFGVRNGYSGNILFDDKNIHQFTLADWNAVRRNKISMLFQELRLFDELTVKENLELKLKYSPNITLQDATVMLAHLGVESFLHKPCKYLSYGQRQRVAVVRSLLQPFEWLLMDEPFSHLDNDNANLCLQLVNEVAQKNNAGYIITCLGKNQFPLNSSSSFNRVLEL